MDAFIKMAVLQTVVDAVELLADLQAKSTNSEEQKRIADMIQRLSTMGSSL